MMAFRAALGRTLARRDESGVKLSAVADRADAYGNGLLVESVADQAA
jgi:hypothetical protein